MKSSDFTHDELEVINSLTAAWNRAVDLPDQHPDDMDELKFFIHAAQRVILIRGARRANPSLLTLVKG